MIAWLLGGELGASGVIEWTASSWVVAAAGLCALLAFSAAQIGARSWSLRVLESLLWLGALGGLVVALAQPVWVEEEGRVEAARVAVLIDASASMGVLEDGTRHAEVAKILDQVVDNGGVYHFGDELAAGLPESYELGGTDFEAALDSLRDRVAGEKLAGVVLISDGLDRGLLRRRFLSGDNPLPPTLPGPLTVFQVGEVGALKDLSVRFVDAGGYAYIHAPAVIRAEVLGVGFEGQTVRTQLLKDGGVVQSKQVLLDDEGRGEVRFDIEPDRAGRSLHGPGAGLRRRCRAGQQPHARGAAGGPRPHSGLGWLARRRGMEVPPTVPQGRPRRPGVFFILRTRSDLKPVPGPRAVPH